MARCFAVLQLILSFFFPVFFSFFDRPVLSSDNFQALIVPARCSTYLKRNTCGKQAGTMASKRGLPPSPSTLHPPRTLNIHYGGDHWMVVFHPAATTFGTLSGGLSLMMEALELH